MNTSKPRVAVVGGGIAGIMAAYRLQHSHQVTIFEAGPHLGGHAHAIQAEPGVWLDTGFIICNTRTYPLFLQFLTELGVRDKLRQMEMSFAFSDSDINLHYAVFRGLGGLFHQKRNLFNPAFYRLFLDLLKFRNKAMRELQSQQIPEQTLQDYLAGFSAPFRENFMRPTAMAIWSMPDQHLDAFPARTLLEFLQNHLLIQGPGGPADIWMSFDSSSRTYVEAFKNQFTGQIHLNTPIDRIARTHDHATLFTADGQALVFDQLILATHANTALKLLEQPTALEQRLLGAWRYESNRVTIHTDARLMPAARRLWSSWNICRRQGQYQVSYYLNHVQNLKLRTDYFLSLGNIDIAEKDVLARFDYAHPIFDFGAIATRAELPLLNSNQTAFCGSYFGYGFHEDAVKSAISASEALLQTAPVSPSQV